MWTSLSVRYGRRNSLKEQSEGTVEDVGWLPHGILPSWFDETAFSLPIGEISEPIAYVGDDPTSDEIFYYLLMVSEKA